MKNLKHLALLVFLCLQTSFPALYAQKSEGISRKEWLEQMETEEHRISTYVNEQLLNTAQNERIKQTFLASQHHVEAGVDQKLLAENYLKGYYREQYLKLYPEVVNIYNPGRISAPVPAKAATTTVVCSDGDFEAGIGSLASFNGYATNSYYSGDCSFVPPTSVAYAYLGPLPGGADNFQLTNNVPDPIVPAIYQTHNGSAHAIRINAPTPCGMYNSGVNMLQKTFSPSVTGKNRINFSYALVMQDPSHISPPQNPFFVARVLDNTGTEIARFCKVADVSDPFFISAPLTTCGFTSAGVYRDWDCAFLEFDANMFLSYTLEFFIADCGAGGHFGYGYVDDICIDVCETSSVPAPINLRCNPVINGPYYGSYLSWDPVSGAVSYIVTIHEKDSLCCRPDSLMPGGYIYDIPVSTTTTSVIDTIPHCFSWTVVAVMPGGSLSHRSETYCSCTPGGPAPYDLRCDPIGMDSRLSWASLPMAVSYKVTLYAYDPACCAPNPLYPTGFITEVPVTGTTLTVPVSFADCFSWTVVGVTADGLETVISERKCSCGVSISFVMKGEGTSTSGKSIKGVHATAIPNPASEYVAFTVYNKQENLSELTLHILDMSGHELLNRAIDRTGKLQIDVRLFLSGVYIYEIRSKDNIIYKDKILIEKQ